MGNRHPNAAKFDQGSRAQHELARKLVEEAVSQHVGEWAAAIGLKVTDQFREDVTEALHACMREHLATPGRSRWRTERQAFLDLAEDYATIAKLLRRWETGRTLPPLLLDPKFKHLPQFKHPPELMAPTVLRAMLAPARNVVNFTEQAKVARLYAKKCDPDKGGRPRLLAFDTLCIGDTLCVGLRGAFERAPERKATSSGGYFRLVTAVWPTAREIAQAVTKQPLPGPPTSGARRKHLERLLKRLGSDSSSSDKTSDP